MTLSSSCILLTSPYTKRFQEKNESLKSILVFSAATANETPDLVTAMVIPHFPSSRGYGIPEKEKSKKRKSYIHRLVIPPCFVMYFPSLSSALAAMTPYPSWLKGQMPFP